MKNFSYKIVPPRFEHKFRGSGLLVMALVGAAVVGVTSLSIAKANSIAISSMGSNKVALQAQQYASAKGELIRATKYSDLTAQNKSDIGNTGFQDEVVVGTETTYDATTMKKDVTIRVYRIGESVPRSSLVVTRYSKSMDASSVPSGSIIPWYGSVSSIPAGYALCNGSNGTPDLRDRFIVGAGGSYALSAIGGANSVTLSQSQIPSVSIATSGYFVPGVSSWALNIYYGSSGPNHVSMDSGSGVTIYHKPLSTLYTSGGGGSHENRPPYYALYYIMKL